MTAAGVLFGAVVVFTVLLWGISFVLIREARQKPSIPALNVMAVIIPLITIVLTDSIASVVNASLGFPVPKEVARFVFLIVLLGIGGWAVWFYWLYRTGRFRVVDR